MTTKKSWLIDFDLDLQLCQHSLFIADSCALEEVNFTPSMCLLASPSTEQVQQCLQHKLTHHLGFAMADSNKQQASEQQQQQQQQLHRLCFSEEHNFNYVSLLETVTTLTDFKVSLWDITAVIWYPNVFVLQMSSSCMSLKNITTFCSWLSKC